MRRRSVFSAAAATLGAVGLGAVGLARPVLAAGLPLVTVLDVSSPEQVEVERSLVRYIARSGEYALVRQAARAALAPGAPAGAVLQFLESGHASATTRAQRVMAQNVAYTQRMVASHRAQYYPRVNAAGRRALEAGTEAELKYFVTTGFDAAKELDRQGLADEKLRADLIAQDDRNFVAGLRDDDPGAQVQAWARRAVAPETTDADVAEFLSYGWAIAAGLDLQTFHRQCEDADRQRLVNSRDLVGDAEAAQAKALDTVDETRRQELALAARAWAAVGAQTGPARVAWADAQQIAARQAATWQEVSLRAKAAAAASPLWQNIAESAPGIREQWLTEQRQAAEQAAAWIALYDKALKAETDLNTTA